MLSALEFSSQWNFVYLDIWKKKVKVSNIDCYEPIEPMTIHDFIIESIRYEFQTRGVLW